MAYKGLGLDLVEVVNLGVLYNCSPRDRIGSSEPSRATCREVLIGPPVELEPIEELGGVLYSRGEGEAFPETPFRDPSLVLPHLELIEKDLL
jgi:hypothetical protein